jgi:CheY-like chemotaxis protein
MTQRVLDVGNCGPDLVTITRFLKGHFDCEILQTHGPEDTLAALREGQFDLVLVNRKLDRDYSDGMEIIRQMKADPELAEVPVMLITNYAEHQDAAVAMGAERGFGKLELEKPETLDKLKAVLGA